MRGDRREGQKKNREMKDAVRVDGAPFEVHKPLDAILEEKVPNSKAPPEHAAISLMRDPIQALAATFSEIRDAEALRVNQLKLDIAVSEAARTQGTSAETLSQILERVSERSETTAQRLLRHFRQAAALLHHRRLVV